MIEMRRALLLVVTTTLLLGCRTPRPPAPRSEILPPAERGKDAAGNVAVIAIVDPNAPTRHIRHDEEYVQPRPAAENQLPKYPPALLPQRLPPQRVGIRFTIDRNGAVRDVVQSAVAETTEDADPLIVNAVRDVVSRWSFSPPRVRTLKDGPDADDNGIPDYRVLDREDVISVYYDLQFTFEVIDGRGVVRTQDGLPR